MDDIVNIFFDKEFEHKINNNILFYEFNHDEVKEYVYKILNEPICKYVEYINSRNMEYKLSSKQIFQFSNVDDFTYNFCSKIIKIDNPGLACKEVGIVLSDDKNKSDGAYVKYGENHAKMARELGLAFELYKTYYVSGIGYIYMELSKEDRYRLLVRMIIRTDLIQYLVTNNGKVNLREKLNFLSDSTYLRRCSSLKRVLFMLKDSKEYDFGEMISNIKY